MSRTGTTTRDRTRGSRQPAEAAPPPADPGRALPPPARRSAPPAGAACCAPGSPSSSLVARGWAAAGPSPLFAVAARCRSTAPRRCRRAEVRAAAGIAHGHAAAAGRRRRRRGPGRAAAPGRLGRGDPRLAGPVVVTVSSGCRWPSSARRETARWSTPTACSSTPSPAAPPAGVVPIEVAYPGPGRSGDPRALAAVAALPPRVRTQVDAWPPRRRTRSPCRSRTARVLLGRRRRARAKASAWSACSSRSARSAGPGGDHRRQHARGRRPALPPTPAASRCGRVATRARTPRDDRRGSATRSSRCSHFSFRASPGLQVWPRHSRRRRGSSHT